ncbi:uncharacterized protein LOC124255192 [Haliotis rubra]|nr:uncharacterized protein LOC124255192 [Haliotis rubra]
MIDLLLTLPGSTAECERGFSQLKIIKTEIRNKLSSSTVSNLLTVQLNSEEVEDYDATQAIHHWLRVKPRRTRHLERKLTTLTAKDDNDTVYVENETELQDPALKATVEDSDSSDDSCYDSEESVVSSDYSDCDIDI